MCGWVAWRAANCQLPPCMPPGEAHTGLQVPDQKCKRYTIHYTTREVKGCMPTNTWMQLCVQGTAPVPQGAPRAELHSYPTQLTKVCCWLGCCARQASHHTWCGRGCRLIAVLLCQICPLTHVPPPHPLPKRTHKHEHASSACAPWHPTGSTSFPFIRSGYSCVETGKSRWRPTGTRWRRAVRPLHSVAGSRSPPTRARSTNKRDAAPTPARPCRSAAQRAGRHLALPPLPPPLS